MKDTGAWGRKTRKKRDCDIRSQQWKNRSNWEKKSSRKASQQKLRLKYHEWWKGF
jgi:hypothetical protein